jgi:PAS domain S-box-containing protein
MTSEKTTPSEEQLRQRIAELEQEVANLQQREQLLQEKDEQQQTRMQLLEALINTIPSPVFYKDIEGRYQDCNPLFANQILGLPKEQIIGHTLQELSHILPPDLKQVYQGQDEKLFHEPGTQTYEAQVRCADGLRHDFIFSKATFMDANDQISGLVGVMMDITDRKRMDRENRTFYTLADIAPEGIVVLSLHGILSYANPAFRAMYGYDNEDELLGRSITDFFPADQQDRASAMMHQVFERGLWQEMNNYQCKDGSCLPVEASVMLIRDENNQPQALAALHRDMTREITREEELRQSKEQIIEAQSQALRQLGSPLLPLLDGVIVMPLIGTIDSERAIRIMETLLEGVAHHNAHIAILDITGMQGVDEQVAMSLVQTAQAVSLLGARVILTGIGPEIAQALVAMDADLRQVQTCGSLQEGIRKAMGHDNSW